MGHGVPAGRGTALATVDQSLGLAEGQCLGDWVAVSLEAGPGEKAERGGGSVGVEGPGRREAAGASHRLLHSP